LNRQLWVDAAVHSGVQRLQVWREVNPDNGLVAAKNPLADAEYHRAAGSIAETDSHLLGQFPQLCLGRALLEVKGFGFEIVGDLLVE